MRPKCRAAEDAFNSLFEMHPAGGLEAEADSHTALSILYLRCWGFLCLVFAGF